NHLTQVLQIEQVSFPTPWSKDTYLNEIKYNQLAHYYVCLLDNEVIGYAGMWLIIDEAHITTIAVNPAFRGKQFGKLLLAELLARAAILGADKATLEVRPSNQAAQNLYKEMGFVVAGSRKQYYTDTGEDAIIMWKSLQSRTDF
ncbi:MAG: ribosomal protein S18-alanine N-acetyltransferase, partial [Bacillota bacterium]